MATLVATIDLDLADSRSRRNLNHLRASHGDVVNFNQLSLQLSVGENETYTFSRFFYAHIRDVVDIEITDANNNTITFNSVTGVFALPMGGKIKLSVAADSTILLDRVIHLVYS